MEVFAAAAPLLGDVFLSEGVRTMSISEISAALQNVHKGAPSLTLGQALKLMKVWLSKRTDRAKLELSPEEVGTQCLPILSDSDVVTQIGSADSTPGEGGTSEGGNSDWGIVDDNQKAQLLRLEKVVSSKYPATTSSDIGRAVARLKYAYPEAGEKDALGSLYRVGSRWAGAAVEDVVGFLSHVGLVGRGGGRVVAEFDFVVKRMKRYPQLCRKIIVCYRMCWIWSWRRGVSVDGRFQISAAMCSYQESFFRTFCPATPWTWCPQSPPT